MEPGILPAQVFLDLTRADPSVLARSLVRIRERFLRDCPVRSQASNSVLLRLGRREAGPEGAQLCRVVGENVVAIVGVG